MDARCSHHASVILTVITIFPRQRRGSASRTTPARWIAATAEHRNNNNLSQGGGFFGFGPYPLPFYQPSTKADSHYRVSIASQQKTHHLTPAHHPSNRTTTMNKGEQPAADAQQINLGLSEERGAVRRDAGKKACGKMRGGSMELKGCNEEYWCEGDYWNGKYFLENALLQKGGTIKFPKQPMEP